jgi:hypothetical protein
MPATGYPKKLKKKLIPVQQFGNIKCLDMREPTLTAKRLLILGSLF